MVRLSAGMTAETAEKILSVFSSQLKNLTAKKIRKQFMPDVPEYIRLEVERQKLKEQIESVLGDKLYRVLRTGERAVDKLFAKSGDPLKISVQDLEEVISSVIDDLNITTNQGMKLGRNELISLQNEIKSALEFDYPLDYQLLPTSQQDDWQTIREMRSTLSLYRDGKLTTDRTRRIIKTRLAVPIHQADAFAITQLAGFDNSTSKTIADLSGLRSAVYFGSLGPNTRLFCAELLSQAKVWTETQILGMNNGQGLPVIRYCGGYRCVHEWLWVDPAWSHTKDILRRRAA